MIVPTTEEAEKFENKIADAFVAPGSSAAPSHPIDDKLGEHNGNPLGMTLWELWKEDFRT
ncbi:MAG: hypothetical protein QOF78_1475, partial [Phycisphaerales bacterium]|nr:hypothetical protein [Phycisphaerales bacterium]